MKYRQAGNSGMQISEIGIGSWLTISMGLSIKNSFNLLHSALEHGVNFIDTADVYNKGEAEKAIGKFLQTIKREEIIIGTKAFGPMSDHWMTQGLSYRHLKNACIASLKRLQTDYIDLYQCHRYDVDTPPEETCFAMNMLIDKGYINHWGISQWSAVQIINTMRICEKFRWRKPLTDQPIFNMLNRSLEVDVMDVCEKENIGLIVYSPLSQGLLTGKYLSGKIPKNSRAANKKMGIMFPKKRMTKEFFNKQKKLSVVAGKMNISMAQLALSWCLRKKPITSVITGASSVEQVKENIMSSHISLSEEVVNEIENILQNAPVDQYTGERIGYGIIKRGY